MGEWVRLYHDAPVDPKWRVIARKAGQRIGDVLAVWAFVLTNASANATERGRTHNFVTEDVAAALDIQAADVDAILAAMEGKVLSNGKLLGWEKRNPIKDDGAAERAKRWRERNRTQPNGANAIDKDTETDRDTSSLRSDVARVTRSKKSKSSLPSDFPQSGDLEWAEKHWVFLGRTDLSVTEEVDKFRDHHTSEAKTSADWSASWRTWAKNAVKFNKPRHVNGTGTRPTAHETKRQGTLVALERIRQSGIG